MNCFQATFIDNMNAIGITNKLFMTRLIKCYCNTCGVQIDYECRRKQFNAKILHTKSTLKTHKTHNHGNIRLCTRDWSTSRNTRTVLICYNCMDEIENYLHCIQKRTKDISGDPKSEMFKVYIFSVSSAIDGLKSISYIWYSCVSKFYNYNPAQTPRLLARLLYMDAPEPLVNGDSNLKRQNSHCRVLFQGH